MADSRQIRTWLRIVLCALLCIGATLDDIGYINAIRAPRTMNSIRASMAEDDTDDQHPHFQLAHALPAIHLNAPFLSALHPVVSPKPLAALVPFILIRSGRAPPPVAS